MSYPMTWKRMLNRNGLGEVDKWTTLGGAAPNGWSIRTNLQEADDGNAAVGKVRRERLTQMEGQAKRLAHDMIRLRHDTLDEDAILNRIVDATGIDPNDVAAVLAAWFSLP